MPSNLTIKPRRNENIERVIKRFNKKVKKLGIIDEVKERRRYVKPSEKRRKMKKRSDARRKKEEAKRKKQTI
jgi:small subunit ribosomal protein S21